MHLHFVEDFKLDSLFNCTKRAIMGAVAAGMSSNKSVMGGGQRDTFIPKGFRQSIGSNGYGHTSKNVEHQVLEATDINPRSIKNVQEYAISAYVTPNLGYGHPDAEAQHFMYEVVLDVAVPYTGDVLHLHFFGKDRAGAGDIDSVIPAQWLLAKVNLHVAALDNHANVWVLQEYIQQVADVVLSDREVRQGLWKLRLQMQEYRSAAAVSLYNAE